ncbi:MAG: hypothetical protein ACJAXK_001177 [Yoonia sp.]|jgi:hypothetical protein
MIRIITAVSIVALMGACSGEQPFEFTDTGAADDATTDESATNDDTTGTTTDEAAEDTSALDVGTELPPGTDEPSADGDIFRYEARDGAGGGLVTSVTYNASADTFNVDNIGFDGANVYTRDNQVGSLNGFALYEGAATSVDSLTGDTIPQITPYRALVGVSDNIEGGERRTSFAIVRTGAYNGYGFGGFVYERNGGVTLPISGQARFQGDYAGIRVFNGLGGMELTRGDMTVDIDFRDFNANDAVKGTIANREAFALSGLEIPLGGVGELALPDINFVIQEGAPSLSDNGEISGTLNNVIFDPDTGSFVEYESGTYYGIIAGDMTTGEGGELVGVIVIESDDPRYEEVTAQETGGFILYR